MVAGTGGGADFALIGRAPTLLRSHWSIVSPVRSAVNAKTAQSRLK